jgi:hypothetical protein
MICSVCLFALLITAAGSAQPLVTDRPDQTESSVTVDPGKVQVEMGYTHAEDDETDKVVTDSLPETLVRFGVVDNFELRVAWGGYQWQETTSAGTTTRLDGATDMAAGLKLRFLEEQGWLPETALGIGLTESLGAFVEFFGDIPTYSHGPGPANLFDGGFTYLLNDNIQLDASAGVGLSQAAEDWFASIGLSFRLPN